MPDSKFSTPTFRMKIVHGADISYTSTGLKHRPGAPLFKFLLLGEENTLSNFFLTLAQQGSFYSPRHHHNFEQFRYAYKGDITLGDGQDWLLREGRSHTSLKERGTVLRMMGMP